MGTVSALDATGTTGPRRPLPGYRETFAAAGTNSSLNRPL